MGGGSWGAEERLLVEGAGAVRLDNKRKPERHEQLLERGETEERRIKDAKGKDPR